MYICSRSACMFIRDNYLRSCSHDEPADEIGFRGTLVGKYKGRRSARCATRYSLSWTSVCRFSVISSLHSENLQQWQSKCYSTRINIRINIIIRSIRIIYHVLNIPICHDKFFIQNNINCQRNAKRQLSFNNEEIFITNYKINLFWILKNYWKVDINK